MTERLDMSHLAPEGMGAVTSADKYPNRSLDRKLLGLVRLRASIINGCVCGVDRNTLDLQYRGEAPARLFAVAAWADSPLFTARERAALALTDAMTKITEGGVPEATWQQTAACFGRQELADLVLAIAIVKNDQGPTDPLRET